MVSRYLLLNYWVFEKPAEDGLYHALWKEQQILEQGYFNAVVILTNFCVFKKTNVWVLWKCSAGSLSPFSSATI